jgi:cell division protein FtsA
VLVGGERITRDIAIGLGVGRDTAEALKRESGSAMLDALSNETSRDILRAPSLGGDSPVSFSRRDLVEIVEARAEEGLLLVAKRLGALQVAREFGSGAVLVGGSARLQGMPQLVRQTLGMSARVGRIDLAGDDGVDLSGPENALGAGLLRWSLAGAPQQESEDVMRPVRWIANAVRWLAAGF